MSGRDWRPWSLARPPWSAKRRYERVRASTRDSTPSTSTSQLAPRRSAQAFQASGSSSNRWAASGRQVGTTRRSPPRSSAICRWGVRSSAGSSVVASMATEKWERSRRADHPGSWRFASSQISRAVAGDRGTSIPKTRRSSRWVHRYRGLCGRRGTVSAQALNLSHGSASPVMSCSGHPARRMARHL